MAVTRRGILTALTAALSAPLLRGSKGAQAARGQAETLTRIAFGSCADQEAPQPIWRAVRAFRPELFIFAGDNVYGDDRTPGLPTLRAAYRRGLANPDIRALRANSEVLAIWDDHDYGVNDGGADYPLKAQSQALFADAWDLPPEDPRRRRPGLYHAVTYGPPGRRLQVILLDVRYFRSPLRPTDDRGGPGKERYLPDPDPAKTMLGETQWAWLAERLREPADLRLVVSSIQVLAEGHGWECWRNLPSERQRLFDLIDETAAGGVVFLSGDRHVGGLYRKKGAAPYALSEITSSSLNRPWRGASEAGPLRLGGLVDTENFGTIEIDWRARRASLSLRGLDGQVRQTTTLDLQALRP